MDVRIVKDYEEMSAAATAVFADAIRIKADIILGLATGSTPEGLYAGLAEAHKNDGLDFSKVRTFNLDEYVGLPPDHEQSYRYFMNDKLFNHVNIDPANTHVPNGLAKPLSEHCREYDRMIEEAGGIDLQVLGIGSDGHIAFNEPGTSLGSKTHVTALMQQTIQDNSRFFDSIDDVPRFAVTMGIASILAARRCVLLVSGANKAEATAATIEGPITSQITASALQMHPDTIAIITEDAAAGLQRKEFYRWQQDNWGLIADQM